MDYWIDPLKSVLMVYKYNVRVQFNKYTKILNPILLLMQDVYYLSTDYFQVRNLCDSKLYIDKITN